MSRLKSAWPALIGAVAGGAVALVVAGGSGGTKTVTTSTTVVSGSSGSAVPTSFAKSGGLTVNQIYRRAAPGVVDIKVISQSSGNLFGSGGTQEGEGAGVVYDTKGNILTDEHVVTHASSVRVIFHDGYTAKAKVIGADPSTDVAVIHVDAPASELHPIPFADATAAQVGDPVVAIGSPFSLPGTTTSGIVSAVGRSITAPNNYTITGAIQTDAAINPGNSGGPLLDATGKVLGLNDQIQTNSGSSAGVGFATPANTDVRIANRYIAGKQVRHSYVGVCLNPSSSGGAQIASTPDQNCQYPVTPGSPADHAGLRAGDVITAINGQSIKSTEGFIASIDTYTPNTQVTLTVHRGGQTRQFKVTLGTRPNTSPAG